MHPFLTCDHPLSTLTRAPPPCPGTGANVSLEMYGEEGRTSGVHVLANAKDNFSRNKEDVFTISCVDLGALSKIRIGHDNSALFGSGWFLDKVTVSSGGDSWCDF